MNPLAARNRPRLATRWTPGTRRSRSEPGLSGRLPGRDNPDLIRRAKNVCRQLDAGDSLTSVGETLQGQNPDWSTRQAGQFAGVAIGAFCQEHRSLLPG
ncbi:DUF732 domain-containing protein [Rhodococcus hoagii]|nr:DUF732 domain-containing protein [Prescottella equi]